MPKRKLTLWVSEQTDQRVRDLSAMHGLTISEVASAHLDQAIRAKAETLGLELLVPVVEAAVHREVAQMTSRLARLLARGTLEAAASRRLTFNVLLQGAEPRHAREINDLAWQRSVESLRKPLAELDEILSAQSLAADAANRC